VTGSIDHQAVWRLVRRQHGVISRAQLLGFGFSRHAIQHRIDRGRLVVIWPGVYRVGPMPLTREGWFMAAVLACGDGAMLSHESAAVVWGIRKDRRVDPRPIHVSVPKARRIRLEGICAHRRNPLPQATTNGALPLSSPLLTLVDLAGCTESDPLEAAINEADRLGLIDPEGIEASLDAIPPYRGRGALKQMLNRYTRTDSDLERRFLRLVKRAGMPTPQTQVVIQGMRVDFYWPDLQLVIETDGLTYHRTPAQQAADRKRDQGLTAAGLRCVRFPNAQVREEPDGVVALLIRLREQLE
jgi:very-short-patch-repair endonuclease